jgi:small subunit ribosomal protein S15
MNETTEKKNPDTGSATAQIAVADKRLENLKKHLEKNPKDKHSRRGLLGLLSRRRKNLKYLEKHNK